MKNDDNKVGMLLDIENFYGEHSGRLAPIIKTLLLAGAPVLAWVYTGYVIPTWLFLPVWICWSIHIALVVLGRQKERVAQFKKQISEDYTAIAELLHIKTVHPDGCIEYVNGRVAYAVVALNGTIHDPIQRSFLIREFMRMFGDRDVDVYIQNLTETKSLESRYSNIKLFVDGEAAQDFIDIIDHNRQVVYSQSLLTRTVFVVKGPRNDWKDIRDCCKTAVQSNASKAFKSVEIAERELVSEILNDDIRGVIDLDALLQSKYATHQYYGSEVLHFDDKVEEPVDEISEERGFMLTDE